MCLAYLHIPLREFYEYTPIEIDYALTVYYENKEQELKLSWEQTRTQIYYTYLFAPSQKRKVSYSTFKKEYLPLNFDNDNESKETPVIDDVTFGAIQDFFKQKDEGTE